MEIRRVAEIRCGDDESGDKEIGDDDSSRATLWR